MKIMRIILLASVLSCLSCNLENEIEIELPGYREHLVVEAYLEAGRPYRLLISRSAGYFDPFPALDSQFFEDILVNDAAVTIEHRGERIQLESRLNIDTEYNKLFNYSSPKIVPDHREETFELEIVTAEGDTLTAVTQLLTQIPIDSVVIEFQENDTLARALTYFTDPPATSNFYRRMLHEGAGLEDQIQDFATDDQLFEGEVVFGTGFEFTSGDTLIHTLYHIDRAYFDFLESVNNSQASNGSPFAQPSAILTNLSGTRPVIGIFTGLSLYRDTTIITR